MGVIRLFMSFLLGLFLASFYWMSSSEVESVAQSLKEQKRVTTLEKQISELSKVNIALRQEVELLN
ncbi:hypothetical protein PAUR_a3410 [Pseudoalteromonas aurantia 208]|uniref:Uncharacterized protein n=2 Tax=Pseudoalteromonas aurantia TaxID=43654 RepID=A0ABR9E6P0_9GAMM|nr:hypothetical protein [Pseudoalteromonas aurantia 208]